MHAIKALFWALLATVLLLPAGPGRKARRAGDRQCGLSPRGATAESGQRRHHGCGALRNAGFDVVDSQNDLPAASDPPRVPELCRPRARRRCAVVYFAGHGIEVDGDNYLMPIDAKLERDIDVDDEAISLERVRCAIEPPSGCGW